MTDLGLAFISMTAAQAVAIATSGEFKSIAAAAGETDVLHGFFYGTDFDAVAKGRAGDDVVLRVDLQDVSAIVDSIPATSPDHAGFEFFALGDAEFSVETSKFDFIDSTMVEFRPLSQILEVGSEVATSEAEPVEAAPTEEVAEAAPAKKQYDTPYLPRGQYFKKLREAGLLQPRQPEAKAEKATEPAKRARSEAEMKAIRGFYARK